ncbi:hypothetical protein RHGRI_031885 [Rhododendron griersonianum]|uniref:Uncharacterized protein n=1 Tax=Rhododendron griersonianum TaxID=479676 RepID=A0AAV6I9G7_9ERIC|nr:hypothetical protein RHGRI_031885 [Rhododendron griersonianum]
MEEVPEDSFGPLPECLLSSSHRPLRGKIREARDETTDEEGEEIEMAPRNIIADLEERKKKKDEVRAKASGKTSPSAGGSTIRSTKSKGSSIQIPDSPAGKRPLSSSSQDKDLPKDTRLEKKQMTDTGSGGEGETTKGKGVSGSAKARDGNERASPEEEDNLCRNQAESWPLGVLADEDLGLRRAQKHPIVGSVLSILTNGSNFRRDQLPPSAAFEV